MTVAKKLTDFFTISERLECELRLTRMSDGNMQAVASHSWNMIMMAIALRPYLKNPVNMESVMELCAIHDLPEAIAHDVPLHQQTDEIKAQKHICEQKAIDSINGLLQDEHIIDRFNEYELRKSPESRLVKLLDILDTGIQHMCCKDLTYVGTFRDNFYWKLFFSKSFADAFNYEPILRDVYDEIRQRVATRLKQELGIDAEALYTTE
ncbi:MAG: HD domain-containing protein [Alphaproteobacteria bacterium]|nr:HD domain-containing protein [Alphaproteobacteria bacterium]